LENGTSKDADFIDLQQCESICASLDIDLVLGKEGDCSPIQSTIDRVTDSDFVTQCDFVDDSVTDNDNEISHSRRLSAHQGDVVVNRVDNSEPTVDVFSDCGQQVNNDVNAQHGTIDCNFKHHELCIDDKFPRYVGLPAVHPAVWGPVSVAQERGALTPASLSSLTAGVGRKGSESYTVLMLNIYEVVAASGLPNCMGARITLPTNLCISH
jgi:hypothetical protein